jgi:hypothetical protein
MEKIIQSIRQKNASESLRDIVSALITGGLALIISLWAFRENLKGLFKNSIPLGGDGLLTSLYIQIAQDSGFWNFFSQHVFTTRFGWPGQLDFSSYPIGNTFELFVIRIFSLISGIDDPSQLIHLFSIAKATPIAISAFVLGRVFGLNRTIASLIGVVYSVSSFNLIRAEGHFFLGLTWSIPLGIAAIFIAFKIAYTDATPSRTDYVKIISLTFLSFLTGYYYSLFLIILSVSILLLLLFSRMSMVFGSVEKRKIRFVALQIRAPFYVTGIFIMGLLLQTIPVLIRSGKILSVSAPADRSPIESVIYAGTPESFFFDFYSSILKVFNRPDLLAFLQTRISWEASQLSSLTGILFTLIIVVSIIAGIFKFFAPSLTIMRNQKAIEAELIFVLIVTIISLSFYFTSPLNYVFSRLIPEIRAWGRFSVVITLMSLLLLGLILKYVKNLKMLSIFLVSLLIVIPTADVLQFRQNRPSSSELSAKALAEKLKMELTINELQDRYQKGCSLVNLPIYPFPEFDRPDDKNIDYGLLQLPLSDGGYFKWSYAGIKSTGNFSVWQPLISEFPPFQRADIGFQIQFSNALESCGAVLDRSFLTPQESSDFEAILKSNPNCTQELGDIEFDGIKRFVLIDFIEKNCKNDSELQTINQFKSNSAENFIWRIDELGSESFSEMWQIFPSSTSIRVRIRTIEKLIKPEVSVLIKVNPQENNQTSTTNICFKLEKDKKELCSTVLLNERGIGITRLPRVLITGDLEIFDLAIQQKDQVKTSSWGVVLIQEFK